MKHEKTSNKVSVDLQTHELWYLAKLFAPGLIFGVEDPSEGLSEEEILSNDRQAQVTLEKAGMIRYSNAGQLIIDEMLGAMIFSCIKSNHILILTDKNINQKWYYFFLPNWQLELKKESDVYKLTHFSNRQILLSTILDNVKLRSDQFGEKQEFFIKERYLELAAFLYDSGKKEKSAIILEENLIGEIPERNEFIQGYNKSENHYVFDIMLTDNNEESIIQEKYEILQNNSSLYWLSRFVNDMNEEKIIHFQSISSDDLKDLIDYVVP